MNELCRIYDEVFYIDGSLRDIVVLGTNEQDWQKLLDFLQRGLYKSQFIVQGQLELLPKQIKDIFAMTHLGINLQIDEKHLALHTHFFSHEEIEFDIEPQDFHDEKQVSLLLHFIHDIGWLLYKEIRLTPEGMHDIPLFYFNPETEKEAWIWESQEINLFRTQLGIAETVMFLLVQFLLNVMQEYLGDKSHMKTRRL